VHSLCVEPHQKPAGLNPASLIICIYRVIQKSWSIFVNLSMFFVCLFSALQWNVGDSVLKWKEASWAVLNMLHNSDTHNVSNIH
jgi:hypothetical protein